MGDKICNLLFRLGLTSDYHGFVYMASALRLCEEEPQYLRSVTKWLYPTVAKQYQTNWKAVERDLRTAGKIIWSNNRPLLEQLAHRQLRTKPKTAQLLSILSHYLSQSENIDELQIEMKP